MSWYVCVWVGGGGGGGGGTCIGIVLHIWPYMSSVDNLVIPTHRACCLPSAMIA